MHLKNDQFYQYPKFWQAANLVVIYIFIQTIVDFPLALYDYSHGTNWLYEPWIKIPLFTISTIFILYLAYFYSGKPFFELFPLRLFNFLLLPSLLVILVSLQFFMNEISLQMDKVLPPPSWFLELFSRLFDSDLGLLGGVVRVVIIAPIVEELIFRGAIMTGFMRNYRAGWAIFYSALLFALFHLNPWQFPATFLLGLLLGWIRIRTNSVLACIVGHAMHNGLVYLSVIFYADLQSVSFLDRSNSLNFPLHSAVLILGLIFAYFVTRRSKSLWQQQQAIFKEIK